LWCLCSVALFAVLTMIRSTKEAIGSSSSNGDPVNPQQERRQARDGREQQQQQHSEEETVAPIGATTNSAGASNAANNDGERRRKAMMAAAAADPPVQQQAQPLRDLLPEPRPSDRDRTVSWGHGLPPPHTSDAAGAGSCCSVPRRDRQQQQRPPTASFGRSGGRIGLEDIVQGGGGYEHEAESAILKAFDRHRSHCRADISTLSILSGIPADVAHDFDDLGPAAGDSDDEEDGEERAGNNNSNGERQRQRPLINVNSRTGFRNKPDPTSSTVDQALQTFTKAMMAMHNHDAEHPTHPESATAGGSPVGLKNSDRTPSSSEGLTRNVLPFRRRSVKSLRGTVRTGTFAGTSGKGGGGGIPTGTEHEDDDDDDWSTERGNSNKQKTDNSAQVDEEMGRLGGGAQWPGPRSGRKLHRSKNQQRSAGMDSSSSSSSVDDWDAWAEFFRPRRRKFLRFLHTVLIHILLPITGVACILYYLVHNPKIRQGSATASASFLLLFGCRQIITLCLALSMQALVIDFLGLSTKVLLRLLGPILTLLIVQSKGWVHVLFWWCIFDFALLSGDHPFAHHWLYFQDAVGVFNGNNPSGHIVDNVWYIRYLMAGLCVSLVVAIKRFLLGLYLGRQTYSHFGQQLAKVTGKMLLVSEVAGLAKTIESNKARLPQTR
jgi:hypothetical protein